MYYYENYKRKLLVIEDKMLMVTTIHFEGVYVIWKGQVRFLRFVDQPNTINTENSEIWDSENCLHMSFTLEKRLIVSLTIINVYEKSIVFEKKIQYIFFEWYGHWDGVQ